MNGIKYDPNSAYQFNKQCKFIDTGFDARSDPEVVENLVILVKTIREMSLLLEPPPPPLSVETFEFSPSVS